MKFDSITCFESDIVKAYFSAKNPEFGKDDTIKGLNVGYNTIESPEIANIKRNLWFDSLELDKQKVAWGLQVHGNAVQIINSGGIFENTDGLVTKEVGVSLNIFVADCAALLFVDEIKKVIGACHAGWRGALGNIVPRTIDKMEEVGAERSNIKVFISPCISEAKFEVGEEVAAQFPADCVNRSYEKPHVNLNKFITHQLLEKDINKNKIIVNGSCTYSEPDKFYSYRREGKQAGRMLATITLLDNK